MVSTRKVMVLTACLIAVDCSLAGMATATGIAWEGAGYMSDPVAIALIIVMAALNIILVKLLIKKHEETQPSNPVDIALAGKLNDDIEGKLALIEKTIAPLLEDLHMRKAEEKGSDLTPL